jgi:hypothetical protein
MLERLQGAPCVLCGTPPARWNEPASAEHPEVANAQADALDRARERIERGELDVTSLHHDMLRMCAMCQEIVLDADRPEMTREVLGRIRFHVGALRRLAGEVVPQKKAG